MTENGEAMSGELQDLVLRRMAELGGDQGPLSLRDVTAASQNMVSHETVRAIMRGTHSGRITDRTAEGLSRALRIPVEHIYRAAGQPRRQGRWTLPERFDRLDFNQRRLVEEVAAAILDSYEKGRRSASG